MKNQDKWQQAAVSVLVSTLGVKNDLDSQIQEYLSVFPASYFAELKTFDSRFSNARI